MFKKTAQLVRDGFPQTTSYSPTTYDRDNGSFKCMLKEGGTGRTLYTKTVGLTVLIIIIMIIIMIRLA